MEQYAQYEPHAQANKARRLTIPELERYIRPGCACSLCEFAQAEIGLLRREASRPHSSHNEESAQPRDLPPVGAWSTVGLEPLIGRITSVLTSWRMAWTGKWRTTLTGPSRKM